MKIIFPELDSNKIAYQATTHFPDIEFLPAASLDSAAELLAHGQADSMISGLDYPSREVVIAFKSHLPLKSKYFSSSFIAERTEKDGQRTHFLLADGGINKSPTEDQFLTIIEDSAITFANYYQERPKIALLSYSTYGSGGKNPDLAKFHFAIENIKSRHPDWLIDGEMQLDAAMNPEVAAKKTPLSPIRGAANVLIVPNLNSGNILYKSLERFGGFTIAGPLIQGFGHPILPENSPTKYPAASEDLAPLPLADLSRGSTLEDVIFTIQIIKTLYERNNL